MGDMLILPNADVAEELNLTPFLYKTYKSLNQRFKVLNPAKIHRMYDSTAAVLPNGKAVLFELFMFINYLYPNDMTSSLQLDVNLIKIEKLMSNT